MNRSLKSHAREIAAQMIMASLGSVAARSEGLGLENADIITVERLVADIAVGLTKPRKPTPDQIEKKLASLGLEIRHKRGRLKYCAHDGLKSEYPVGYMIHLQKGDICEMPSERWRERYEHFHIWRGSDVYLFNTWTEINAWADEQLKGEENGIC